MFSKSQRFKDIPKKGTPGPGDYNVKDSCPVSLPSFPKGQRFSDSSDTESNGSGVSATSWSEFKVPPAPKTKKKLRRKVASVQTDIVGEITITSIGRELEVLLEDQKGKCLTLQDELALLEETRINEKEASEDQIFQRLEELAGLKSELELTKSLLEQNVEDKSKLTGEISTFTSSLSEIKASNEKYEIESALIKASLDAEKDCVCQLQSDLDRTKLCYETEAKELSNLKGEFSEKISYQQQTIKLQEESIDSLTTSLGRETELRTSTEAALENKNDTIACLKSTLSGLQQQLSNWEQVKGGSEQRQGQLEHQVASTTASLNSLTDQLQHLKLANQQSRSQNEELHSANQSSAERLAALERSVVEKEEQISALNEKQNRAKQLQDTVREKDAKIEELLDLNTLLSSKLDDTKLLRNKIASLDDIVTRMMETHKEEIASYEGMLAEARTERDEVEQRKLELEIELNRQEASHTALKQQYSDRVVSLQTKLSSVQQALAEKDEVLVLHTAALKEERDAAKFDFVKIQALYEELQEKIAPFKEQLDAYELERKSLEGQTKNWASEAAKATQEYAKLLGHQNQKQKIRRITQISNENFNLKQEVMNLRSSDTKLKRQLSQQQEKIQQLEGKKRFDPNRAFQREDNTENEGAQRAPLKPFNACN